MKEEFNVYSKAEQSA